MQCETSAKARFVVSTRTVFRWALEQARLKYRRPGKIRREPKYAGYGFKSIESRRW